MNRQQVLELLVQGKDQASGMLGNVGGSLASLGGIAGGIATGGLALAGAGIVALGAAAVGAGALIIKFSQDTDTAMSKFAAQTGAAGDELGEFKEIAKDVYAAGLGDSIGDVVEQMALVHRGLDETGETLEDSTRRAMILARVFEVDVGESIKWVSSMTKSWRIDSEEAFDIITKGMQMGLDVADDFGDTLHEYSGDFNRLGFTADHVLSMLNAGLEAGAYNTDVIADGWREYGIRLMEGGDQMTAVFDSMGLDFERMQGFIAAGDETWGDYAGTIVEGLMSIESEVERNAAGVAIFGTKWEDLGGEIFLASGQAMEGIEGIAGATDAAGEAMDTGIMPAIDRLKRKFETEFAPLGDKAGEVIDKMIPYLEKAADWLGEKVPLAIDWLEEKWERYWPIAKETLVGFWDAIEPKLERLQEVFGIITETALPLLQQAWADLGIELQDIVLISKDQLVPALEDLWISIGLGSEGADIGVESFGLFLGVLSNIWTSRILQNIKNEIQGVANIIKLATTWIDGQKKALQDWDHWLRKASDMLDWMNDRIWDVIYAFSRMVLPDWLTPGSPTPLEIGLLGVGKAFESLPATLPVSVTGGGGGGAGAGGMVHITNYFGRDSVRSDADIRAITDAVQRSMELQGMRSRIA